MAERVLDGGAWHLMAADEGPTVQSAILRNELLRLRREKNLTQEKVAAILEWSSSKLIRIEGGRSSITKVDLDALLEVYGITAGPGRDRFQALNRAARLRGWWYAYHEDIDAPYLRYVGYEAGANYIRQFPGPFMPGLLQTAEYAEALTTCTTEAENVSPVVRLRLQRQAQLQQRSDPPRQSYVLDEAVIRRHVGIRTDPFIMPDQLDRIVGEADNNAHIAVRLIPFNAGEHPGLTAFTVLGFDGELRDRLYLDSGKGEFADITDDDAQVAEYAASFEALLDRALPERESIEFIRDAAEEMRQKAIEEAQRREKIETREADDGSGTEVSIVI
jgi:transcriptional regulator with XRE-family HTH domain